MMVKCRYCPNLDESNNMTEFYIGDLDNEHDVEYMCNECGEKMREEIMKGVSHEHRG